LAVDEKYIQHTSKLLFYVSLTNRNSSFTFFNSV